MASNSQKIKYASLCFLSVQSAAHVLMTRYSRASSGTDPYIPNTLIALGEVCKLVISAIVVFFEQDLNLLTTTSHICNEVVFKPRETFKLLVPSALYVLQNNLLILALSNLDSATYQVCYQTKILTTAVFSVVMLNRRLQITQWVSLLLLTAGVALVQLNKSDSSPSSVQRSGSVFVGMMAIVAAACTSGFSGVYFEKVLKGSSQSLWIRNIQLAGFSVIVSFTSLCIYDREAVLAKGFFQGYTVATWIVLVLGVLSGLTVALVVKYADNILKGFAASISILISTFVSYYYLNDFEPTLNFFIGAVLVILATFLYSVDFSSKPKSLQM